jgi:hypothetical protein
LTVVITRAEFRNPQAVVTVIWDQWVQLPDVAAPPSLEEMMVIIEEIKLHMSDAADKQWDGNDRADALRDCHIGMAKHAPSYPGSQIPHSTW